MHGDEIFYRNDVPSAHLVGRKAGSIPRETRSVGTLGDGISTIRNLRNVPMVHLSKSHIKYGIVHQNAKNSLLSGILSA